MADEETQHADCVVPDCPYCGGELVHANPVLAAEYVAWLEAELTWAYSEIMGDTEDTQEHAGWRAFNGSKKLAARIDGSIAPSERSG